jgi:predicted transcriptional regulator
MKNRLLVTLFVDGSEVDYLEMLDLGLIARVQGGYVLTDYGKSFLTHKKKSIRSFT